jgi:hypothetical protein
MQMNGSPKIDCDTKGSTMSHKIRIGPTRKMSQFRVLHLPLMIQDLERTDALKVLMRDGAVYMFGGRAGVEHGWGR